MQKITIKRGNTCIRTINLRTGTPPDDTPYTLLDGEKIIFTLKASEDKDAEPIIKKEYTNADYDESDNIVMQLTRSETDITPGTYYFACAFQRPAVPEPYLIDFVNGEFSVVRTASEEAAADG